LGIDCVLYTADDLHSLCMIDLFAPSRIIVEDADGLIEGSSHELSASRSVINISYSANMVLMNNFGLVHLTHIEGITVRIVITYSEVDRLNWIERKTHGFVGKGDFLNRSLSSQIVKN
jgi:hypothetical protein